MVSISSGFETEIVETQPTRIQVVWADWAEKEEGVMDKSSNEQLVPSGSSGPLRSDRYRTIVSEVVVAKIAGIAAQDVEGVRIGGGAGGTVGSFLDRVGWDGQPRGVSARVVEQEAEIDLTMSVGYGKVIPPIIEEVRPNVVSRVESQVGHRVAKVDITVNDVLLPEVGPHLLEQQPEDEQTAKVEDEEQNSAPSPRLPSSSTYSPLGPGGTYLDFWTRSLEQYQQMREAFLGPFTGKPR
jgi:uncharacterized alkaline shock family protein YloU